MPKETRTSLKCLKQRSIHVVKVPTSMPCPTDGKVFHFYGEAGRCGGCFTSFTLVLYTRWQCCLLGHSVSTPTT
ncbi:hypothetical protein FQN60_013219, partial [Etheostoma spectabile]